MPKRKDIRKILLVGSGPIVIGQACEFDYSGTQACKALKKEGYSIVLVNSNPATIMTDPAFADRTYIEPITPEMIEKIIVRERPDAILPTMGGQTALNVTVALDEAGILKKYGVQTIGASVESIKKAEDRKLFKEVCEKAGVAVPKSEIAFSLEQAVDALDKVGLPCVIRSSFNLGGMGSGIAYNIQEFEHMVSWGLQQSMIHEVLIEESIYGWKEFEMEVMRDKKDNCVIVCSIENFDPMGIHTGESITVAPAQTLTDKEYQTMRTASFAIIREVGVECGGANIQFAVNPEDGRMVAIEMNPRVSRSSALASKATGFPIAKIAALLAVGYTLDEIQNEITRKTPACFEPSIDYVVVKVPRWAFEKFPEADRTLTTQMKSVGEVMSIGQTFKEALQKAVRSLELGYMGLGLDYKDKLMADEVQISMDEIREKITTPNPDRLYYIRYAFKMGIDYSEIAQLSRIDPWFLRQIWELTNHETQIEKCRSLEQLGDEELIAAKAMGFSDVQISRALGTNPGAVYDHRRKKGILPVYKQVDTCAGEFEAFTPYYYSTYGVESEHKITDRKRIMIIGSGPNRIGQGIEFDYCCVHAAMALREMGFEVIMCNCNPETVSTDYDTSDHLFFEPLTVEDILHIYEAMRPEGIVVTLGGQTPLNIARTLAKYNVRMLGTSVEAIDRAEDRQKFKEVVDKLKLVQPLSDLARTTAEAKLIAQRIGLPVLIRPSYVLGGRAMEICYTLNDVRRFVKEATEVSPMHPVLIDKFIEDAIEIDVDALSDGEDVFVAGILEHIEMAGVHSGDSSMVLPPFSLSERQVDEIRRLTTLIARELEIKGLLNIQFAVKDGTIYVLEVNPRSSRTVPFVSKAIGIPIAKFAARIMVGQKLRDFGFPTRIHPRHFSVKMSVFPFKKFHGVDIILSPEMKSTGEVMGVDRDLGLAYAKAHLGSGNRLPMSGNVFISVKDADKRDIIYIAKKLRDMGFKILSTPGTANVLRNNGVEAKVIFRLREGRPNVLDYVYNNEVALIINTPSGKGSLTDEGRIRAMAIARDIPVVTTIQGAQALVNAVESMLRKEISPYCLQEFTLIT